MSTLRDQHKAFADWFLQQNPIAPNVEDMAWAAWKAALAAPENRPCTCHPDDNPPQPCAQRYALTECKALAQPGTTAEPVAWQSPNFSIDSHGALSIPMPAGALHLSPERTRQLGEFLRVTVAIWSGT